MRLALMIAAVGIMKIAQTDADTFGEMVIGVADYVEHPKLRLAYLYGLAVVAVLSTKWLVKCLLEYSEYWTRMHVEQKLIAVLHTILELLIYNHYNDF